MDRPTTTPRSPRFDAVIAGAGPAGSSLALRLAREGFSVALVEPKRFPRRKPCGEFLSPECLPMLADLGVADELARRGARRIRGMRIHGHGRKAVGHFGPVGRAAALFDHGLALRREVLDDVLLRAALATGGVELLEGFRVERLVRDGDGFVLGVVARGAGGAVRELSAGFTVGADGVRSRVAGRLGVQRMRPWLDKLALVTRYAGARLADTAEVHLFPGGFFAAAPVDGGLLTLNLVVDRRLFAAANLPAEEFVERRLATVPILAERLSHARRIDPVRGTGPLSCRTTEQAFDGAALVGDACGYVDPVTGEGIFFALRGAELLSRSIAAALRARRTDRAALLPYLAGRRRDIEPRERFGLALQRGLRHPALVRAVLGLLESRPRLADVLVSVTGDYVPLRELARPSVWTRALAPRTPASATG